MRLSLFMVGLLGIALLAGCGDDRVTVGEVGHFCYPVYENAPFPAQMAGSLGVWQGVLKDLRAGKYVTAELFGVRVEHGVRVRLLGVDGQSAHVRIVSGDQSGREGWTHTSWITARC